jgi:GA4 desaturase
MPGTIRGTVRYNLPDLSVRAEDRGLFSGPAHKYGEDVEVDLYDPELSSDIVQGSEGLDVQGFTYVKAPSALDTEDWLTGTNVEEIYVKEVEELVKKVTGAKKVIVNHLGIRKRLATNNADPTFYRKRGDKHDEAVKKLTEKNSPWGKLD